MGHYCLGAKSLALVTANTESSSGELKGDLESAAGKAGISARFKDDGSVERQVLMEFGKPSELRALSDRVKIWLEEDPILKSFVEARQESNLLKSEVSLVLREHFELASTVWAKFQGVGVNLGGEYSRIKSSKWVFEVEFWPAFEE